MPGNNWFYTDHNGVVHATVHRRPGQKHVNMMVIVRCLTSYVDWRHCQHNAKYPVTCLVCLAQESRDAAP